MKKPKQTGGNLEEQKTTEQPKHPTTPRHRGHNGIFSKDRFKRGGLFQYQAEQYFRDVRGEPVGEDILADERSQRLDGDRNTLREQPRELRGEQKSLENSLEKRGKSCGTKAARNGYAAPRPYPSADCYGS